MTYNSTAQERLLPRASVSRTHASASLLCGRCVREEARAGLPHGDGDARVRAVTTAPATALQLCGRSTSHPPNSRAALNSSPPDTEYSSVIRSSSTPMLQEHSYTAVSQPGYRVWAALRWRRIFRPIRVPDLALHRHAREEDPGHHLRIVRRPRWPYDLNHSPWGKLETKGINAVRLIRMQIMERPCIFHESCPGANITTSPRIYDLNLPCTVAFQVCMTLFDTVL